MILVLIQILITVVIGAILFWLIDRFIRDGRLANLLKILVVLVCLASILQRLLPMLGIGYMCSAATRSACPSAGVKQASTTSPLRFSIRACPMKQSLASLPGPLR